MLDPTTDPDYDIIPDRTLGSIERYVLKGIPGGHFLQGIITNDLFIACSHADEDNKKAIPAIVKYFYNQTPGSCWGTRERHTQWLETGGIEGRDES